MIEIKHSDEETARALEPFSACDCSDALYKLKIPNAGFIPGPRMVSPRQGGESTKIVGQAYTVLYARMDDAATPIEQHYIDHVPKSSVVFISAPQDINNAVYGGLMSTRAKARGAVGTVVHGRVRDLREHWSLEYPVFACDVGTAAPFGAAKVIGMNVALHLSSNGLEMSVHPGDWIVGDIDGVVVIPEHQVKAAIALMQARSTEDRSIAHALVGGMSFTDASKLHRK